MAESLYLIQVFKEGKLSKQFVSKTPEKWIAKYELSDLYSVLTSPILELNLF